jgi:hypothetical protein
LIIVTLHDYSRKIWNSWLLSASTYGRYVLGIPLS